MALAEKQRERIQSSYINLISSILKSMPALRDQKLLYTFLLSVVAFLREKSLLPR